MADMRIVKTAACLFMLTPFLALADATENVQVPSLKVKERLQSIEQINVTAEKKQLAIAPESAAVAALLREADAIEAELSEGEDPQIQSPTH
jgi:hypothetical protein